VKVLLGVTEFVGVCVTVGVSDAVGVWEGVGVSDGVKVTVGVAVSVGVGENVAVGDGVNVGGAVGVSVSALILTCSNRSSTSRAYSNRPSCVSSSNVMRRRSVVSIGNPSASNKGMTRRSPNEVRIRPNGV